MPKNKLHWIIKYGILTLIAIVFAMYIFGKFPHTIISSDTSKVSRIFISGNGNGNVDTKDRVIIEHIVTNLGSIKFKRESKFAWYTGNGYMVNFYSKNGKNIKTIIIESDAKVLYDGYFRWAQNDKIDFKYIENLEEKARIITK